MYVCNACVCVFTHIGAAAHCTTVLLSTGSTGGVRAFTRARNGGRGEDGRRTGIGKGDTDKVSLPRSYYGTKARKESGGGEGNERRRESYPYTIDIRLRFLYTITTCYTDGWNRCSSPQFRLFLYAGWLRIYDSGVEKEL